MRLANVVELETTITSVDLGFNPIDNDGIKDGIKEQCQQNKKSSALRSWSRDTKRKKAAQQPVEGGTENPLASGQEALDAMSAAQKDELLSAFAMFDQDGDGTVDASELGAVLAECNGEEPSAEELQEMIEQADEDGSGIIEKEEFLRMMARQM